MTATGSRSATPTIDQSILNEAADWLVLFQSGEASELDREKLARWCARSPAHQAAWERGQEVFATFRQVPPKLGRSALSHVGSRRRQVLGLGLAAVATPALAWLAWRAAPWQEWTADLHTGTGEQKTFTLADGSRLMLNTASAVNISYTARERRLRLLAGEILIDTAKDPSSPPRPFLVDTSQGRLRALGTRFTVRGLASSTHLAVLEGAVEIQTLSTRATGIVRAGEQTEFTSENIQAFLPTDINTALWEQGMLMAREIRLDALLAELGRYQRGVLRCDGAVADMLVSGACPVTDPQRSLTLLEKTLPIRVSRLTNWWITVSAR
jgi:transmembrane sensor